MDTRDFSLFLGGFSCFGVLMALSWVFGVIFDGFGMLCGEFWVVWDSLVLGLQLDFWCALMLLFSGWVCLSGGFGLAWVGDLMLGVMFC